MATRRGEQDRPQYGGRLLRGRRPRLAAAQTAGLGAPSPPTAWPPASQHSTAAGRACRLQNQQPRVQECQHPPTAYADNFLITQNRENPAALLQQHAWRLGTLSCHIYHTTLAPDQPAWSSASSLQTEARPCPPMHSAISTTMSWPAHPQKPAEVNFYSNRSATGKRGIVGVLMLPGAVPCGHPDEENGQQCYDCAPECLRCPCSCDARRQGQHHERRSL